MSVIHKVVVMRSEYASKNYQQVSQQEFNTEFAARLYGFLFCQHMGADYYWVLK